MIANSDKINASQWIHLKNGLTGEEEIDAVISELGFDELWVTDHEGNVIKVNKQSEPFYGVSAKQIIGKNVRDLEKMGLFCPSVTMLAIQEKRRVIMVQTTKSGRKLILSSNPIFNERGEILRFVNKGWDITDIGRLSNRLEETEKLLDIYQNEIRQLRQEKIVNSEIVYTSPLMQNILRVAEKVAVVESTVLLEGESGVGKGMIAAKIHQLSHHRGEPFVTINCGAIPESLFESELFGYEGGAFTGAKKDGKRGLLEVARGGTIFFDEISELSLTIQVKLLNVIQEKKMIKVGGEHGIDVHARILAATNKNLKKLVQEGKFREDLFYRLNVVPLEIPSLRKRKEDIPPLVDYFSQRINSKYGYNKKISPDVMELFLKYDWPGNVRELENLVERLIVTVEDDEILPINLPPYICEESSFAQNVLVLNLCPLEQAVELLERQLLKKGLMKYKNTREIAKALGISQSTVIRKLQRYQIR